MGFEIVYNYDPSGHAVIPVSTTAFWVLRRGGILLNGKDVYDELIKLNHPDVAVNHDSVCVPMEAVELMWKYIAMGGYAGLTLAEFIDKMMGDGSVDS